MDRIVEGLVGYGAAVTGLSAGHVVWRRLSDTWSRLIGTVAIRILLGRGRKQLVGNSHFDVIGLGRKHRDRLVPRFPAEPRDGAVIGATVGMTGNAERRALRRRGVETAENFPSLNGMDQAQSKHLQRDSERQISGG